MNKIKSFIFITVYRKLYIDAIVNFIDEIAIKSNN